MPRFVYNPVGKLRKSFGQVWGLPTLSTDRGLLALWRVGLYLPKHTANARFLGRYAQPQVSIFNLLGSYLCSVSTAPITNTKLIKGI